LLSHHGEYEYGSPKIPQTSEAMLVHMIDLMDSKMHSFETVKRTDKNMGHWSGYVKHLDRIVFKDELPSYTEYITPSSEGQAHKKSSASAGKTVKPTKPIKPVQPAKGAMADALKNFKV
jgi:3'-5' exoribonuclease